MTQVLFEKCSTEEEKYAILSLLICKVTSNPTVYDALKSWVLKLKNGGYPGTYDMLQNVETLYENLISKIGLCETIQVNKESCNKTSFFNTKCYCEESVKSVCGMNRSCCSSNQDGCMTLPVSPKPIRVLVDGVFDLVHSGHFNALRQAACFGESLVVGVVSDEEVLNTKGTLPIYTLEERVKIVQECKWVSDCIISTPYTITLNYLESIECDYVAHGDDIAYNAEGVDCYEQVRQAGRLKVFRRTEGLSSTDLMSRLLKIVELNDSQSKCEEVCEHLSSSSSSSSSAYCKKTFNIPCESLHHLPKRNESKTLLDSDSSPVSCHSQYDETSHTLLSSKRLCKFLKTLTKRLPYHNVIYTDGCFDLFHAGHVEFLKKAKEKGDYLIVGIFDNTIVKEIKGCYFPVHSLLNRGLSVAAMRCVDEVLFGVPYVIPEFLIKEYHVNKIVASSWNHSHNHFRYTNVNKSMLHIIDTTNFLTSNTILSRISPNNPNLVSSVLKRKEKEKLFYKTFSTLHASRPNEY